ncbi:hypothetical protein [Mycobacterium sp. SMC-11]|uniref:hypothetical protein n=1 Tax=Mycobacterium sp. SMC-11 TaxID=3385969 RepID=UPI00390C6DE3
MPTPDRTGRDRQCWREALYPLLWWATFIVGMFLVVDASIATTDAAPVSLEADGPWGCRCDR